MEDFPNPKGAIAASLVSIRVHSWFKRDGTTNRSSSEETARSVIAFLHARQ